ncbi:unnamed protein product [Aspergillus oryzae var. brunneus]|uniref:Unnamed protein product n=1 Tax=Aspergillus oryzae var. brunneus TaxID=332754 RepID=A0ABQ6KYA9_ASPOZ|nr:unnamed protein product [Aspergillus oryzae var. brunneus]
MKFTKKILTTLGLLGVTEANLGSINTEKHVAQQNAVSKRPPNFLFIMSDDQDLLLDSLSYTPLTMKHMRDKGTTFNNHFVTTALCCPSRVSLWTGRLAHNTNVTDVHPPWGFDKNFLPVWLQQAGYDTYYTGKLMNAHSIENYASPHVSGFNGSDFLLDPYTYDYMNATYQRNHDAPVSYLGRHTTEVLTEKAMGFLEDALSGERPFFMAVSPIAPHSNMNGTYGAGSGPLWMDEPIPEDRHKHLFPEAKVPRKANFNPKEVSCLSPSLVASSEKLTGEQPTGVSWIHDLPFRNETEVDYNDHYYRQRLRALQGVDELVDSLVTRLEQSDKLDNTYIIYTSDNGFHIGQHRLPPGKTCGFDEDIRVPFFIRGPGIPEGAVEDSVSTHIDLAPTFYELAGIPLRDDFDGAPMRILRNNMGTLHEHNDPYQINNLYAKAQTDNSQETRMMGYSLSRVITRLDALLLVLKSCKGTSCIEPWSVLHPGGSVHNLRDALNEKYDSFYQTQSKVSFDRCEYAYIIDAEGPQEALAYRNGYSLDAWV